MSFTPANLLRLGSVRPPDRHGLLEHEGHQLAYEEYGRPGDPVLVYLHGLLLDNDVNRSLAIALARLGNRVVLLELLGHGGSDKPAHASAYRMDLFPAQVVALLDHLEVEWAAIGGISLGANVSLYTALQHPERVRALVLEMPVLEWAAPVATLAFVPLLLATHYAAGPVEIATSAVARLPRTGFGFLDTFLAAASHEPDVITSVLHGLLVGPLAPTREERAAIATPALVLAHDADLLHPLSDGQHLAELLSDARLVRARSFFELRFRPQRLTAEIGAFLAQH